MRSITAISVLVATAWAQGVTQYIAPRGKPPSGCVDTRPGKYELSVEPLGVKKRDTGPFPPREKVRWFEFEHWTFLTYVAGENTSGYIEQRIDEGWS
jgi:hypothetical protein